MKQTIGLILFLGCLLSSAAIAQQDSSSVADSVLQASIQRQMSTPPPVLQPRSAISTNPNMSVIGDFEMMYLDPSQRHFDAEFHEAEIALQSVVDPYARADFFLSIARDPGTGQFGLGLEEGYLTSLDLPAGLQVKIGKFRSTFGKINNIHPHALPFISLPNVYARFLGEEGLNDEGISASWLIPNPLEFYQELTVEATRGPDDSRGFLRSAKDHFLFVGHLKNFWDLTDDATFELGLSGAAGPNDSALTTILGGVDLTYKWKPLQFNTYQSFVVQAEALLSSKEVSPLQRVEAWGMYALATYQVGKRWFLTGRWDYANLPDDNQFVERAYSGTIGWYATEFQKMELECKSTTSNVNPTSNQIVFRSVFVIGAHGAHAY